MHQPEVVLDALLKAGEEFAEPVVPGAGALHYPAPGWMAPIPRDAFATMPDVREIAAVPDRGLDLRVIVPFVETQVLVSTHLRSYRGPYRQLIENLTGA